MAIESQPTVGDLLALVDQLLSRAPTLRTFEDRYAVFREWLESYMESYLHSDYDALTRVEFDYFSEVYEQACEVSFDERPTDEDLSYGQVSLRDFLRWVEEKRQAYVSKLP